MQEKSRAHAHCGTQGACDKIRGIRHEAGIVGRSVTAAHRTLNPRIQVRILAPQPEIDRRN